MAAARGEETRRTGMRESRRAMEVCLYAFKFAPGKYVKSILGGSLCVHGYITSILESTVGVINGAL